jgi:hypothetical protein
MTTVAVHAFQRRDANLMSVASSSWQQLVFSKNDVLGQRLGWTTQPQIMLRNMQPVLCPELCRITVQVSAVAGAFANVSATEGLTVIAPLPFDPSDIASALPCTPTLWPSDTAAFVSVLTDQGISANVVAGFFRNHVIVP